MVKEISPAAWSGPVDEHIEISLVQLHVKWNGCCQIQQPLFESMSEKYASWAGFYSMDMEVDNSWQLRMGLNKLPAILIFRGHELVDQLRGLVSREMLESRIQNVLNYSIVADNTSYKILTHV